MSDDLRTSEDWNHQFIDDLVVMDPDGWDHSDLERSWYGEKITREEFLRRRIISTLRPRGKCWFRSAGEGRCCLREYHEGEHELK